MPASLRSFALGLLFSVPFVLAIACSDDDTDSVSGTVSSGAGTATSRVTTTPGSSTPSSSSLQGAESELCNDLDALGLALSQMNSINSSSTVAQLQTVRTNIQSAMDDVKESAADVRDIKVDDLEGAYDDFDSAVDDVAGSTTLGSAATSIQDEASAVVQAQKFIDGEVPCP
jgi:hypothetical protein